MGRMYLFECSKCGYRARVAGGAAAGVQFAVQTIACLDCRELHDVVVRCRMASQSPEDPPPKLPRAAALWNRLPWGGKTWVKFKPICPVSTTHRIRLWKQPGHCPKCGVFLEPHAMPFRVWD